jgi:hypothetical protein
MKSARTTELERIYDAVAGVNWIADPERMLFVVLTGADPKAAQGIIYEPLDEIGGKIPQAFKDQAMVLYGIAGKELNKFSSQRLCLAIEAYLSTLMTSQELATFKAGAPMKYPVKKYASILEEMEAEGIL